MSIITKIKIAVAITASIYLFASNIAIAKDAVIPQPKAYSTITGDTITVGDVFEGVKANADFYLAPAPEIGKIRVISLNELVQISQVLKLGWEPEHNLHRIPYIPDTGEPCRISRRAGRCLCGYNYTPWGRRRTSSPFRPQWA